MCGIAGISLSFGSSYDFSSLNEAVAALAHRGPDDAGVFEDLSNGIGLAHTRLSILDTSLHGHQPMVSEDGRVVLVFNGEIYNFRQLRSELEREGHIFYGNSDTEVLLRLYIDCRVKGANLSATLRRLNGIFAFALWDAEKGALLLVRDALGVKPLYIYSDQGVIAFASEIKALKKLVSDLGKLDIISIDRYMTYLWCPGVGTPLEKVQKLGPGEAKWVVEGNFQEQFFWYSLPAYRPIKPKKMTSIEAVYGVTKYLRKAVHQQMVSDVPLGAFLSGGLDSSSIVAFAREMNPEIRCFTIASDIIEEGTVEDLHFASHVAEHLKVPLDVVKVEASQMAQGLEKMVLQLDEPLADPASLNLLLICEMARQHGIKVLLSGVGGDDLFTGYSRHRALIGEKYWSWLPLVVRSTIGDWTKSFDQRRPLLRRLRKLFNGAQLEGDARIVNYFRWVDRDDLLVLYTQEFRAELADARAEEPMLKFLAQLPSDSSRIERMLALEQRFFLADHNLNYTDKMSMAAGVEVRVPFLDLELIDFAATIPDYFKLRGRESKWVLKKVMEPFLPHRVIYRPKTGFGVPLRRWMRYELREFMSDLLSSDSLKRRGLFDVSAVQRLISKNDTGQVDASYTLFSLLCIELWCRHFLDRVRQPLTILDYDDCPIEDRGLSTLR